MESILRKFSEELRFVFITSEAKVLKENGEGEETEIEGLKIKISKTKEGKCERCWHSRREVGSIKDHPTLCNRCLENIGSFKKERKYTMTDQSIYIITTSIKNGCPQLIKQKDFANENLTRWDIRLTFYYNFFKQYLSNRLTIFDVGAHKGVYLQTFKNF